MLVYSTHTVHCTVYSVLYILYCIVLYSVQYSVALYVTPYHSTVPLAVPTVPLSRITRVSPKNCTVKGKKTELTPRAAPGSTRETENFKIWRNKPVANKNSCNRRYKVKSKSTRNCKMVRHNHINSQYDHVDMGFRSITRL